MEELKFLADVNVEKALVDYLIESRYDVKWIPHYDCRISDDELLKLANDEKRILITNDKDFGELTFLQRRLSTGIILLRIKRPKGAEKVNLLNIVMNNFREKLFNHFIVITERKIRIIPLEGRE